MRNLRLLALFVPALFLVPVVACEDPSSPSGVTFAPEAGPGFEAGPPPEAGPLPDGALPDVFVPPATSVTVTVFAGTAPAAGVRVIFHDATGAVSGEATTSATGKVSVVTAPSMVTVLSTKGGLPAPVTFMGVAAGDNLRVVGQAAGSGNPAGSFDVAFGAVDPIGDTATSYTIQGASNEGFTCGSGDKFGSPVDSTIRVDLSTDCVTPKNAVLATASNTGGPVGYAFKKDILAPVGLAVVPVAMPAFTAPGTATVKASNLPIPAANMIALLYAIGSGQPNQLPIPTAAGHVLDGNGLDFATPTGFADAYQIALTAPEASNRMRVVVQRTVTPPPAVLPTIDFATALPIISDLTIAAPSSARPSITLVTAGAAGLAAADAAVFQISWAALDASIDSTLHWTFVTPPATTTFKVPALPANAADFAPGGATVNVDQVDVFDASQLPSYQAAKTLPVIPGLGFDIADFSQPLPGAGTLRVSRATPAPVAVP